VKRQKLIAIALILVIGVVLLGNAFFAEYRLKPDRYSASALELTPLGTSASNVLVTIEEQFGPAYRYEECLNEPKDVNEFSYSAQVASHWIAPIPIISYVYVFWCFDENDELKRVEALKVGDGL
jgi:hypothetical protein